MDTKEKEYLIYGGIGLLVMFLAFSLLNKSGGSAGTVSGPSPAALSYAEKMYSNETSYALAASNQAMQTLTSYENQRAQLELGLAQLQTNVQETQINAQSAQQIAATQAQATDAVATLEANAQQYADYAQAHAAEYVSYQQGQASQAQSHTQQQTGLYASIANALGSIASLFGA